MVLGLGRHYRSLSLSAQPQHGWYDVLRTPASGGTGRKFCSREYLPIVLCAGCSIFDDLDEAPRPRRPFAAGYCCTICLRFPPGILLTAMDYLVCSPMAAARAHSPTAGLFDSRPGDCYL